MNIVDLIQGQIGSGTLSKLASSLGIGTDQARTAVDASVPSLLAGLTHVASTDEGARRLDGVLSGLDDQYAANPASAFDGGAQAAQSGGNMLGSLFGGNMLNTFSGAISRFTGLPASAISSLLGMVGPMVLGVLKKQKTSMGLDANGLSTMLAGQKQNIASAMPSGLGNMLSGLPGIGSFIGGAQSAYNRTADTTRDAYNSTRNAVDDITPKKSALPWIVGLAALILLGFFLWRNTSTNEPDVTNKSHSPVARDTSPLPRDSSIPMAKDLGVRDSDAIPAAARIPGDAITEVSGKLTDTLKSATDAFSSITDADSASNALPKLRDVSSRLDSVRTLSDQLPAFEKTQFPAIIRPLADKLNPLIDKALAIPGVGDKIGPVASEIRSKLTAIAGG